MPEIEKLDITPIGIYKIPPPSSLPATPHITRQLDLTKPTFEFVVPTYEPLQFNRKKMQYVQKAQPPAPSNSTPPPASSPPVKPPETEVECPGPTNLRIGDIRNSEAKEKVIGHKVVDGKCIEVYAPTTFQDKFLPSPSVAATTFGVTIVATAAASLTPILTKALKPVFKQIITRVKKLFGKKVNRLSLSEIRANSYREKKGLPPLK
jgi:hypothetical protein